MKLVIRTFVFHVLCIIVFTYLYLYLAEHFKEITDTKIDKTFIDFLLLSSTIQAGVGISELLPITYYSKITVVIQQILMLFTHIITLYVFTL